MSFLPAPTVTHTVPTMPTPRTVPSPCSTCRGAGRVVRPLRSPPCYRAVAGIGYDYDRCPDCGGHGELQEPETADFAALPLLDADAADWLGPPSPADLADVLAGPAQSAAGLIFRNRHG